VAAVTVYSAPDDGRKRASETCRVLTPNKENKKKLHLVGIYMVRCICSFTVVFCTSYCYDYQNEVNWMCRYGKKLELFSKFQSEN